MKGRNLTPLDYNDTVNLAPQVENMGGMTRFLYLAPLRYFTASTGIKVQILADAATAATDVSAITATHTFLSGKGFHKYEIVEDTGEFESNMQGETEGKSFKNSAKIKIAGLEDELLALQQLGKNEKYIFLLKRPNSEVFQIGSELLPGHFDKFDLKSGKNSSGLAGAEVEIFSHYFGLIKYTGTITVHP